MAILKIARMGHPVLLQKAEPVKDPTAPEIKRLVADMFETLDDIQGAGLAAPPLPGVPYKRPSRKSKQASRPAPAERGATGFLVFSLFWLLVISATLACVIQMVRAPDNIPDVLGIDTSAAHETFSTLKELGLSPKPISWTVNGKAINQFLESTIDMKPVGASMSAMSARFQRAFVKLDKGSFAAMAGGGGERCCLCSLIASSLPSSQPTLLP